MSIQPAYQETRRHDLSVHHAYIYIYMSHSLVRTSPFYTSPVCRIPVANKGLGAPGSEKPRNPSDREMAQNSTSWLLGLLCLGLGVNRNRKRRREIIYSKKRDLPFFLVVGHFSLFFPSEVNTMCHKSITYPHEFFLSRLFLAIFWLFFLQDLQES